MTGQNIYSVYQDGVRRNLAVLGAYPSPHGQRIVTRNKAKSRAIVHKFIDQLSGPDLFAIYVICQRLLAEPATVTKG